MKISLPILFILGMSCFFFSCKKDGSGGSNNSNRLKYYIEDGSQSSLNAIDSFAVSYDNSGRITSLISPDIQFKYAYSANSFTLDLYTNVTDHTHELFFLNSAGTFDSTIQYDMFGDTTTEKYTYTGSQLSNLTEYMYANSVSTIDRQEAYTYDNNGNLIKDITTDYSIGSGEITDIATYTYTQYDMSSLPNPLHGPVQAKNLPSTETHTDGGGNLNYSKTYTWTFDSQNRVVKDVETYNDGEIAVRIFVYQ